jgi:Bacterial PH domain
MSEKPAKEPSPKQKHFKEQFEEEDVLLVFKKHPVVMRKGLILAMFGILLGTIPGLIDPEYSVFFGGLAAGFVLGLILMFPSWVRWYFSVYIMTNHRFIQQSRSMLQVNVVDIGLEQIQMINYQISGLQETLLGFGTITVQTYVGDLVIRDVHHPARVQKKMIHILRDLGIHASTRPMPNGDEEETEEDEE